ncbi:hypothetical protein [Kordia sp.]|uniref:hypothetical protein n=1 Tax=Kordia sp. TaxID=1965332 RepID=UPI003D2BA57C
MILIFFLCFQIAALVAAIWYWHSYKDTTQRYFLWFLIYVVSHEVLGLLYQRVFDNNNDILYNIFTLVSFPFYCCWFYKILQKRKWLVYVLSTAFAIAFLNDIVNINPFDYLYLNPIIIGAFCILVLTISYFVELLNKDAITTFASSQKFWIVTGLFSFYIGLLPLLLFHSYLSYEGYFYETVITVLNAVLYSCYLKSFICLKKKI